MIQNEQRRSVRVVVEVAAEVYTSNDILPASTRNLSSDGVCLELSRLLEEGGQVGVSLFLTTDGIEDPDNEPVNLQASVIWCTETDDGAYLAGARFSGTSPAQQSEIDKFLAAITQ